MAACLYQEYNHRQIYVLSEFLLIPLTFFVANSIGITLTRLDASQDINANQVEYFFCYVLALYFTALFIPPTIEGKHRSTFWPLDVGKSCYTFHLVSHALCVILLTYNWWYCAEPTLSFCPMMSLIVTFCSGRLFTYSMNYSDKVEIPAFNLTLFQLFAIVSLLQYKGMY